MNLRARLGRLEKYEERNRKPEFPRYHLITHREGEPEEIPEDLPEGTQIIELVLVSPKHDPEEEGYEPSESR